jgi:hypothetical protein
MASVTSYENCPNCGGTETLWVDFDCRTNEESQSCARCGYYHNNTIQNWPEEGEERPENWEPEYSLDIGRPTGSYHLEAEKVGYGGYYTGTPQEFIESVQEDLAAGTYRSIRFTYFENGTWMQMDLVSGEVLEWPDDVTFEGPGYGSISV